MNLFKGEYMNNFGEFLKQKRQENNLTQKALAKILFVTESTVSKWEKNVAHPDITLLPKLSEILGVTEHELITASIDNTARQEKVQAKKWRTLSFSWNLFFYISYAITILVCFICNLATEKTLSWFWIVVSALLLSFTFTNLPKLIKNNKLFLLPLSMFLSICLLLGICAIYTGGDWFWVASLSILFGLIIIFLPIYIAKYEIFSRFRKYNDFVSIAVDFIALNILLFVINLYAKTAYLADNWYFSLAFPISLSFYVFLNILLSVRFLKTNKFIKTGLILVLIDLLYLIPIFVKVSNSAVQKELDETNILRANFLSWLPDISLENNIHCIIFLTILCLSFVFLIFGLIKNIKKVNKNDL